MPRSFALAYTGPGRRAAFAALVGATALFVPALASAQRLGGATAGSDAAPARAVFAVRGPAGAGPPMRAFMPVAPRRAADDAGFARSGFARFMAAPAGRLLRVAVGGALVGAGTTRHGAARAVLFGVGAVPVTAGALDLCFVSALAGSPLRGRDIRRAGAAGQDAP